MGDDNLTLSDDGLASGPLIPVEPCFALTGDAVAYLATHVLANAPADPDGSF